MSEDFQPITAAGSGKSEAEIAFELVNKLKGQGVWGERNKSDILDMFAECLDAARGLRKYEGQSRFDAPIVAPSAEPRVTAAQAKSSDAQRLAQLQQAQREQAQREVQRQVQEQTERQAQRQAQQQAVQQPVQAQQQMLQQKLVQG